MKKILTGLTLILFAGFTGCAQTEETEKITITSGNQEKEKQAEDITAKGEIKSIQNGGTATVHVSGDDWMSVKLTDILNQQQFSLNDFKDKNVLLALFSIDCTECKNQHDYIKGLMNESAEGIETRNSIVTILLTRLGERVHLPEFGSRLYELVFEQLDDVFRVLAQQYVFDAISAWEPRVNILSTSVIFPLNQPHVAHLSMIYIIRGPGGYRDSLTLGINRQIGSIMVV